MNCYKINSNEIKVEMLNLDSLKNIIENYNRRDLHFIENDVRFDISSLTIKKNCIIAKLDNVKLIIFLNEAYVIFNNNLNDGEIRSYLYNQNIFHLTLFEFFLIKVINTLENEFTIMFNNFLLIRNDKYEINKNFIILQSNLINLEYRVKELHSITEQLLNNKEDLQKLTFNTCELDRIEELIENYDFKLEDIHNDIAKLVREMDNIQKVENIKLAKDRNKFAIQNLYISYISLSVSIGSFIGSMFGMNLKNYLENNSFGFFIVVSLSIILVIGSSLFQISIFRKNLK
jgi:magnesium transporter